MRYQLLTLTLVLYTTFQAAAQLVTSVSYKTVDTIDSIHMTNEQQTYFSNTRNESSIYENGHLLPLLHTINSRLNFKGAIGFSKLGRPIEAFYFPGSSDKKALIIGGVHGSELSAIEIARTLAKTLQSEAGLYYNLVIVLCLFPDNEITAMKIPDGSKRMYNLGRYSSNEAVDPNRQMPAPGEPFDPEHPFDYKGRKIEEENQLLLELMHEYRPDRVVNLHAIRDIKCAGIFADPRTDYKSYALGYASDSSLAIDMAKFIYENGGNVSGNHLDSVATSLYHNDPEIAPTGMLQRRNFEGSALPAERGHGISLGTWASTAVCDSANPRLSRPAMRLLTVEFPGYRRPADYPTAEEQVYNENLLRLYTLAIKNIFLSPVYEESKTDGCDCSLQVGIKAERK